MRPKGQIDYIEYAGSMNFHVGGEIVSDSIANALFCVEGNELSKAARDQLTHLGWADEENDRQELDQFLHSQGLKS